MNKVPFYPIHLPPCPAVGKFLAYHSAQNNNYSVFVWVLGVNVKLNKRQQLFQFIFTAIFIVPQKLNLCAFHFVLPLYI